MCRRLALVGFLILRFGGAGLVAQVAAPESQFITIKQVAATPVKNQAGTGTCWSFSTTSLIESQAMMAGKEELDLSEMFTVRNIYVDKARNYLLRQGAAQFGPGGLGHDVINAYAKYGAVPESVYSGLLLGKKYHDHSSLDTKLKSYLDSLLKIRPIPATWMEGYQHILDDNLGKPPETFIYKERSYTPITFARDFLKFRREDYVFLTSFTHHAFYTPFIIEIPDNYANESYYNVPLNELIAVVQESITKGYSVMWNSDVSNINFRQKEGLAMMLKDPTPLDKTNPDAEETIFDQHIRQQLFENLTTQDDHLMHIIGMEKTRNGKKFFVVKNSWGQTGQLKGYIKVSEAYFAINTMTVILPRAALNSTLKSKLKIQ
jgi:bleomycin hydrolase